MGEGVRVSVNLPYQYLTLRKGNLRHMKTVLQHILRKKREYATLPFFEFLRDERLTPRERLAFYPCMAPFILSFGDLNRYVLRDEPAIDPFQAMINAHTYEDDHHWPWYLEDFKKLGYDQAALPCDTLRFQYSDATAWNRVLSMKLASLIWGATPLVRLAVVEAIEETGNVLFALTSKLAGEMQQETGVELRYLGEFHFQLESGHAMNNEHAELAKIGMDDASRRDALERVELVFAWFQRWTEELLQFAVNANAAPNGIPVPESVLANQAMQKMAA